MLQENSRKNLAKITGPIKSGNALGRQIGFPTYNLSYEGELEGVYLAEVFLHIGWKKAAVHIGSRPTIDDFEKICEVHVVDWDGWGHEIISLEVVLLEKIRDVKKFKSVEELAEQLARDVDFVRRKELPMADSELKFNV